MMTAAAVLLSLMLTAHAATNVKSAPAKINVPVDSGAILPSFSYRTLAFKEWPNAAEKHVLNLYPGFRDDSDKPGWRAASTQDVILFIAQAGAVLDRPADSVDFQSLINLELVRRLQDGFANVEALNPQDIETVHKDFLAYRNPPDARWCDSVSSSLCFESRFVLDSFSQFLLTALTMSRMSLDNELRAQSELRFLQPDSSQAADLKRLTGVSTAPAGLIVQNIFWFNHVMEFGKVVGVVQPLPQDARKSVLTGFSVFAIERKWWDRTFRGTPLSDTFLGKHLNSTTGLTMGLPKVTQQLFNALTEIIKKSPGAIKN